MAKTYSDYPQAASDAAERGIRLNEEVGNKCATQVGKKLLYGDCLEVLRTLADNSVDSIVTDPPYGLSFMGRKWDYDVPSEDIWRECLRVLKPGGHLLAFAGTRTQHRMAVRIEDAGFEIRDMIAWIYGSGFPKSHDVSKAIDRMAGAEREVVGRRVRLGDNIDYATHGISIFAGSDTGNITAPATDAAKQWQGWGTSLKPSLEPVTVARKPLCGTVAENVLQHGTGGLNIDGCRIGFASDADRENAHLNGLGPVERFKSSKAIYEGGKQSAGFADTHNPSGRWPANLIHDGSEEVVAGFPVTSTGGKPKTGTQGWNTSYVGGEKIDRNVQSTFHDSGGGSAARFFYCAKASKRDRDEGCEGLPLGEAPASARSKPAEGRENALGSPRSNHHPTVKPTDLMRYLCRLVTPPGGTVLDPFMGSGSTGKAAILEGFDFIGIEREAEYMEIAKARIEYVSKQPKQGELDLD